MTTEQLDLLSGPELRDAGTEQVRNHNEEWAQRADVAVGRLAFETVLGERENFCAEDVRQIVGDPPHPNVMGSVFLRAVRRGVIVGVGWKRATRREGHACRMQIYRGTT